jgi:hypothetical protein
MAAKKSTEQKKTRNFNREIHGLSEKRPVLTSDLRPLSSAPSFSFSAFVFVPTDIYLPTARRSPTIPVKI